MPGTQIDEGEWMPIIIEDNEAIGEGLVLNFVTGTGASIMMGHYHCKPADSVGYLYQVSLARGRGCRSRPMTHVLVRQCESQCCCGNVRRAQKEIQRNR